MNNVHLLTAKYLGPTNTKGARVKVTSKYHRKSFTLPVHPIHSTWGLILFEYAIYGLLTNMGYRVLFCGSSDGYLIDTFGVINKDKDQGFHSWIPFTSEHKSFWVNLDYNSVQQFRKIVEDFNELVDHVEDQEEVK